MSNYTVIASTLNIRSTPSSLNSGNIITRLKNREEVAVTDSAIAEWYKIKTIQRNPVIDGYVSSKYLQEITSPVTDAIGYLTPVNLLPNSKSRRNNHDGFPFPLSEPDMPRMGSTTDAISRINIMHQVVNYLAVDTSERYKRDEHTYCNIYAFDYTYLCGAFLPRVWWTDKSLIELKEGINLSPKYETTVDEMSANGLFDWLERWGENFGWTRTYDLDELQTKINEGEVGVISGHNLNSRNSGHICCVIPEKDNLVATRVGGKVTCPLLSQAGAKNLRYYNNNRWWFLKQIKTFGFWYV